MISGTTKKWGNSIGIIIPYQEAQKLHLRENQKITLEIVKTDNPLKELFGALHFSKNTKEMLNEHRRNESKFI